MTDIKTNASVPLGAAGMIRFPVPGAWPERGDGEVTRIFAQRSGNEPDVYEDRTSGRSDVPASVLAPGTLTQHHGEIRGWTFGLASREPLACGDAQTVGDDEVRILDDLNAIRGDVHGHVDQVGEAAA